jgi:hypothetical protein
MQETAFLVNMYQVEKKKTKGGLTLCPFPNTKFRVYAYVSSREKKQKTGGLTLCPML